MHGRGSRIIEPVGWSVRSSQASEGAAVHPSTYCVWYQNGMEIGRPEWNREVERRTANFPGNELDVPKGHRDEPGGPLALVRTRPILRTLSKGGGRFPAAPTALPACPLVPKRDFGSTSVVVSDPARGHPGRGVPNASARTQPILRTLTKGPVRSLAALEVPALTSERTSPQEGPIPDRWAAEPRRRALRNQRRPK